jgi:1-pyrroline-5-carboxylate dehydrogenase
VNIIAPFNFPLEIPVLQLLGALISGNKVLIKSDNKVSIVLEQFIRLMLDCGMPSTDVDFINCDGLTMQHLLEQNIFKMT